MKDIPYSIIREASAGNITAFEQIYRVYSGFVYNVAFRILNNKEDGEEAVQEAFVKIYRNLDKYKRKSSFKTWLYRVAVNVTLNRYRKRVRDRKKRFKYGDLLVKEEYYSEPKKDIQDKETKDLAMKMLNEVSYPYKICVILRDIQGLSYKSISETLGINVNTVRSRLRRGRLSLLEMVKKRGGSL